MLVKVFMNSAGHNHEREILRKMHDGIEQRLIPKDIKRLKNLKNVNKEKGRGTGIEYCYEEKYSKCDLAVIFGSWKPERTNIHHVIRSDVVENAKSFICIETPLLGRQVFQPNQYQRVGINGFLNKAATWGPDIEYPDDRLKMLNIHYSGWKRHLGNKIVIAMQLAGDASLRHNDINQWTLDSVKTLRKYTDRPIEIRTHPGVSAKGWSNHDEMLRSFLFSNIKNVTFVNGREIPWEEQILDAYCVVTYTSGLAIDAVVNGIPVIACDQGNFAWNVAETRLENVESLSLATENEVYSWLKTLSYCQWTPEEMQSGICWDHLKDSVEICLREAEEVG